MIIPRIHEQTIPGESLFLPPVIRIYGADHYGEQAAALFRWFLPTVSILQTDSRKKAQFVFECRKNLDSREGYYEIHGTGTPVIIRYSTFEGARNGAATIAQLLHRQADGYTFPATSIQDWPDTPMRSLMLDPARQLIPLQVIKDTIVRMALAKYNYLHLHLSDGQGYAIQSDVIHFGHSDGGGQYTKAEIRHIVQFAEMLGITCIPEVEFPAHAFLLLQQHPEMQCVSTTAESPSGWAACAGSEDTYIILEQLYTELAELFPGPIIHVGTDEIEMNDLTDLRTWPTWHCCARCREMCVREEIDPNNRTEIFYYMLRRIYRIISGLGRRVMMWNDNIDISKSPELPRDILIHFWRIAAENRGPRENCSMQRFLEEGFEIFNSYFVETYMDGDCYGNNDDTIRIWSPLSSPAHDKKYDSQILGGEACAWNGERGLEHYNWTLPSAIMLFGDRMWNHTICENISAFGLAGTRYQLGIDVPEHFDLFKSFGGFMQPRSSDGTRMWVERAQKDLSSADKILGALETPFTYTGRLAGEYHRSIDWLLKERERKVE